MVILTLDKNDIDCVSVKYGVSVEYVLESFPTNFHSSLCLESFRQGLQLGGIRSTLCSVPAMVNRHNDASANQLLTDCYFWPVCVAGN